MNIKLPHEIHVALCACGCHDSLVLHNVHLLEEALSRMGCRVDRLESFDDLNFLLESRAVDVVMLPLDPCSHKSLEMLNWLRGHDGPPVLTMATSLDVDLYLEAMRRGAFDCVGLPVEEKELFRLISKASETRRLLASA